MSFTSLKGEQVEELGKYIVLEGPDGVGKTTQLKLLDQRLFKEGVLTILLNEPGHPRIRELLLDPSFDRPPKVDAFLHNASRMITMQLVVGAISGGVWSLVDRSYLSTLVYQGHGHGVPLKELEIINQVALKGFPKPDLILVLTAPQEVSAERLAGKKKDYYESQGPDFNRRVREGYLIEAKRRELPIIDASAAIEEVEHEIWRYVEPLLEGM